MRPFSLAALTAAMVVLPATAALAHPSFNPDAVPVGEPVRTVLVVPHGCSTGAGVMPEKGEAVPTTRFDLQTPPGVVVEPGEADGWEVIDDGEAIVWTDAGGATIDPIELPVTLTVEDGAAGDQLDLAGYQECEDGSSYRWTEGSEDTPPIRLELTEGDTSTDTSTVDVADGHGDMEDMDHAASETEAMTGAEPMTEAAADGDGNGGTIAAVVAVLVVLLGGGAFAFNRSRRSA